MSLGIKYIFTSWPFADKLGALNYLPVFGPISLQEFYWENQIIWILYNANLCISNHFSFPLLVFWVSFSCHNQLCWGIFAMLALSMFLAINKINNFDNFKGFKSEKRNIAKIAKDWLEFQTQMENSSPSLWHFLVEISLFNLSRTFISISATPEHLTKFSQHRSKNLGNGL